ncbi:hypothetical protein tloyanaT_23330 [Thalassotalea loyana]|uniref:Glucosidase YgjK N-terminal domain-containing protein n=1 Tax=Thalassotalea loyana TaxID=280483 RepID=A0ABQ6HH46_9GAMM|nr:hypothetical protein [Thalassotalea loyana]GLX86080.1 hypothetical protein tloyanaT_23330 [Thalassotalea loyana]
MLKLLTISFCLSLFISLPVLAQAALITSINTNNPLFRNLIDRTGTPQQHKDYDLYKNQKYNPFIDMGAWHGFLLPAKSKDYGAFTGPMVIAQEYSLFIADKLEQLTIIDNDTSQKLDFATAESEIYSQPGALIQHFNWPHLSIKLELHFISNRTALVTTDLINKTSKPLSLKIDWHGQLLSKWDDEKTVTQALPTW